MDVVMTAPRLAEQAVAVIEAAGGRLHYMPPYPSAGDVAALAGRVDAVAILSRQGPVTAGVMDAAPNLKIIARHGVGVDDVDVGEATRRGIVVTRAPGSNTRAVAEHTMALCLALVKDLLPLSAAVAEGGWRTATTKVRDVAGLRLGLVGYGAIGRAVDSMARPFGLQTSFYDPSCAGTVTAVDTLLRMSDVVSLHLPYGPGTRHILGAEGIAAMPAGSFVINTARGGLIDEAALLAALDTGHIGGAGLDVFETEPPSPGDALRRHPRVIATPHVAGVTDGSLVTMGVMAAESIAAVLRGESVLPERLVVA